jgi:hypothetical protein
MSKIPVFTVLKSEEAPWFLEIRFRFHRKLKDQIKAIPGSRYLPETKGWRIPTEVLEDVLQLARRSGFQTPSQSDLASLSD